MEQNQQDHLGGMDIQMDQEARQYLNETSKWAKFISIVVFVFCGLMVLFAVIGSTAISSIFSKMSTRDLGFMAEMPWGLIVGTIVFIVLIVGFIYYFLFNFAIKTKKALLSEDSMMLSQGLKSLKKFVVISTVLSILALINSILTLFK